MQRNSTLARRLLQLTAVVFVLNASFAYGACCETPAADDAANQKPPCHTVDAGDSLPDADDCCVSCLTMIAIDADPRPVLPEFGASQAIRATSPLSIATEPPVPPPD